MKLVNRYENTKGTRTAVVKFDKEWEDYIVKFYIDGVYQKDADYHAYDDCLDAEQTAKHWALEEGK